MVYERKFTEEQLAEMKTLYIDGMSQDKLAKKYGVSQVVIGRRLHMMGVPTRARGHQRGSAHPSWKGGRQMTQGYSRVWVDKNDPLFCMAHPDGYVLEHRLVMARHLGRPLTDQETVHHIDGDRSRNVIENLQLRQGKHGKHAKFQCQCCGSFDVVSVKLD